MLILVLELVKNQKESLKNTESFFFHYIPQESANRYVYEHV